MKANHDDDLDSLELEFLTRGNSRHEAASSSLTPMLLDLDEDTPARDEVANGFFGKGHETPAALPIDEVAREAARFESPAFKERQRYLARYVAGAVAASGVICLAAFFRVASAAPDVAPHAARASLKSTSLAAADLPQAAPVQPSVAVEAPRPAPEPALTAITPATTTTTPTTTAPATDAPPATAAAAPASVGPSARQSKDAAMHALERGNWAAAIAAAERSVRLDPTDGEAWLILGGAYQERGSDRAARHAYVSCAQSAKPGHARSECASLARSR